MQHVKKQWLTRFALGLVGLDIVIFSVYGLLQLLSTSDDMRSRWGITPAILTIVGIHAAYVLIVFPFLRKKFEWLATIISVTMYAILFAAIIDTSGNTNLYYRFGYAVLVFLMGMIGPFAPIATIALTWLVMVFAYVGVVTPTNASVLLNLAINSVVTIGGLAGWLFFRKYYVAPRDARSAALSRLLNQTQHETNAILESITDGVMIITTGGTVRVLNESAAAMFALNRTDALKQDYRELFPAQTGATTLDTTITSCLESGETIQNVCLLKNHDGREFYVDIVASPIYQDTHEESIEKTQVVGTVAVLRDVDQKQRQEQSQKDFVATASHEMRTPVAAINGFIELALSPAVRQDDTKLIAYLDKAHQTIDHLSDLLNHLLLVSQSEENALQIASETVDVVAVTQLVLGEFSSMAKQKHIALSFEQEQTDDQKPLITADNQQLKQILRNLVSNALKYTPDNGRVSVQVKQDNQRVLISVADTGQGIAPDQISELFQKFHRVDNSKTREVGGSGLGLYITKLLVDAMQGTIAVDSTVGQGSTFTVSFPAAHDQAAPVA